MNKDSNMNIGVIGYGYWGPNIVRNLMAIENVNLVSICDRKTDIVAGIQKKFPNIRLCSDYHEITRSKAINAVAVITPVSTHFELVKDALNNGKHIFVEKPFTSNVRDAEELISLANKKKLKIMVDHTFLFTGAVKKMHEIIKKGTLGDLLYYDSTRINLGLFQHDINVIWDLVSHDLAVMDYVIKKDPIAVSAIGLDNFKRNIENIAYVTLYFKNNMIAHFNVNWLSPVKIRLTLIGGTKKMLAWNDLDADEKIKIYDKGVNIKGRESIYKRLVEYRSGDMHAPRLEYKEALKTELEYFIEHITKEKTIINDAYAGLRVVKILEATDKSLKRGGAFVKL